MMKKTKKKMNRVTNDSKSDWIEFGKEEAENWIKNLANDDALRVAVYASDFDDAEETLNRQDDYQYDYFKNDFRYRFKELWSAVNKTEAADWNLEEYRFFKQGWIDAVKEFGWDIIQH
nr:hypothetical protein [uncultured Desulfobacter sp.]